MASGGAFDVQRLAEDVDDGYEHGCVPDMDLLAFCIASLIQLCLTSCVLDIELNELSSGSDRGGIR